MHGLLLIDLYLKYGTVVTFDFLPMQSHLRSKQQWNDCFVVWCQGETCHALVYPAAYYGHILKGADVHAENSFSSSS
jgi:hypothetical protein